MLFCKYRLQDLSLPKIYIMFLFLWVFSVNSFNIERGNLQFNIIKKSQYYFKIVKVRERVVLMRLIT